MTSHRERDRFDRFAGAVAKRAGHATAFVAAVAVIVAWAIAGPIFGFSDTWQLVINTGTTVLTFMMVFLIQNSLNRDSLALHVKLDELLRVTQAAHHALIGAENLSERRLQELEADEQREARTARPDLPS